MPVKKIASLEVQIGMFVSSLDRPWSETPFLFQGFMVKTQEDIEQLCNYSKYLYILVPDDEIEITGGRGSAFGEKLNRKHYAIEVDASEEIEACRISHNEISLLVEEIEEVIDSDSELLAHKVKKPVEVMVGSVNRNPDAYVWLTRLKKFHSYLYRDSLSASVWASVLGRQLGLAEEDLESLATGVMLMDTGKTSLPQALLEKHDRLTMEEWELMKTHVQRGVDMLSAGEKFIPDVMETVLTHHERLDGSGYPSGLKGRQIPLFGQIAGIVDFYVSVTTPRPYAKPISPSKAIAMLYEQKGRYFDEELVSNFIEVLGTYPTGSLVELSTGEVGVIMSQNPGLRLKPNIVLLLNPDKRPYSIHPNINLISYTQGESNLPVKIIKTLPDGAYGIQLHKLSKRLQRG